jgi:hypothetical protein
LKTPVVLKRFCLYFDFCCSLPSFLCSNFILRLFLSSLKKRSGRKQGKTTGDNTRYHAVKKRDEQERVEKSSLEEGCLICTTWERMSFAWLRKSTVLLNFSALESWEGNWGSMNEEPERMRQKQFKRRQRLLSCKRRFLCDSQVKRKWLSRVTEGLFLNFLRKPSLKNKGESRKGSDFLVCPASEKSSVSDSRDEIKVVSVSLSCRVCWVLLILLFDVDSSPPSSSFSRKRSYLL